MTIAIYIIASLAAAFIAYWYGYGSGVNTGYLAGLIDGGENARREK